MSRICSSERDFENEWKGNEIMVQEKWIPRRSDQFWKEKGKFANFKIKKTNHSNSNIKGTPLFVTYPLLCKSLSNIINKNSSLLHMDKDMKRVFTLRLMVLLCSGSTLNNCLVRLKLYPLKRMVNKTSKCVVRWFTWRRHESKI